MVLKVRPAPLVLLGCPLCVSPALLTGVPVRRRAVRESPSNGQCQRKRPFFTVLVLSRRELSHRARLLF